MMARSAIIFLTLVVLTLTNPTKFLSGGVAAQDKDEAPQTNLETNAGEGEDEWNLEQENGAPEEPKADEVKENEEVKGTETKEEGTQTPAAGTEEGDNTPVKLSMDAVVYVDYQFFNSNDAFKIKYHLKMSGIANLAPSVVNGDAEIATEVNGLLAKWNTGQCILDVKVAKVPFEMKYNRSGEDISINTSLKGEINEIWESKCTFFGKKRPLISQGPPEKWLNEALGKTMPPLSSLTISAEKGTVANITFEIPEYDVIEEGLGGAKVKGSGVLTIEPTRKTTTRPAFRARLPLRDAQKMEE